MRQISSQVIVDFGLAFQNGIPRPEFQFPTPTKKDERENNEIAKSSCSVTGCRSTSCVKDECIEYLKKRATDVTSQEKLWLDWYKRQDTTEKAAKTMVERLQEKMGENAMLLPSVVPAFVLRSRKWGKLEHLLYLLSLVSKAVYQRITCNSRARYRFN
jgi:hypothetical protein